MGRGCRLRSGVGVTQALRETPGRLRMAPIAFSFAASEAGNRYV